VRCPVCNSENPDAAKFCSNCGNRLPERKTTGTSERKVVTVLFCDVKGSTAFAEKIDPEEWTEVIDGAFRALTPPIQRYGGTVARLLGDAVLAFFGAPVAHEDDPERAIRAGLEMLQATAGYRDRLVRERGAAFSGFEIRVGINTGLAVIGDVGTGQSVEYTGMGDAVNVAARLQSLAAPGTMLVSEHTLKWVPPVFEWEPVGDLDLKGREGKLAAFRVTGFSASTSRSRPRGLVTPLVGRAAELAALRDAVGELDRGSGRIVSIVGDAGLGKTRLIDELRKACETDDPGGRRWSEARGQSYEQTRSYGLFRQHLLSLAGAGEADPPEVIRARVAALLPEEKRSDERSLRTLEVFLAVESGAAAPGPEGQELRTEVHRLMHDLLYAVGGGQCVVVFDDLQWSDPASAELLMELFEIADEAPVLFICAFRPDRQAPSWRIKQKLETDFPHRYAEIVLPPLSMEESAALLASVLPGDGLPPRLRARILDKAEGNPFFLEEIVRALIDDGTIARDATTWKITRDDAEIRLPESLQAVLAARIDKLEADSRGTLQAAAVIGRTFLYRILAAICEASDKLDRQLLSLQRLELVRESAREPEREYAFRHALTQEAAYGSILQRKRRELHLRVGEALAALFVDRAEEFADRIGHHFAEAGDPRAVGYLKTAADRSLRLYALEDAIAHYRRALALVRSDAEDARVVTGIHLRYGRALELRGDFAEALALYQELERVGRERADPAMEGEALSAQIVIHTNPTAFLDPARAAELADRTIELARTRGDRPLLAKLLWNKAQAGFWQGAEDVGLAAARESASIAREIGDKEQLGFTLNTIGQIQRENAQLDEADAALRESIELFRGVGNRPMEADSLSTLGFIHLYRADFAAALDVGARAYRISDEIGNDWGRSYALFTPSYVHYEVGDWGKAMASYEESIRWAEKAGFYAGQAATGSDLGLLYALAGDTERSVAHLERIVALAATKFGDWRAWPVAQLARALVVCGDLERAAVLLGEAKLADRTRGNLYMSVNIALGRAELALARGLHAETVTIARRERHLATDRGIRPFEKDFDLAEGLGLLGGGELAGARAALQRGVDASRSSGSRRLLWRLLWGLADVLEREGRPADAAPLRREAREVAEHIAVSLRERGLEERFRARPEVRQALGQAAVR
jgi:class 3 adenylate cyclase/tetratricopeptide (TPR) repeat protein